MKINKNTIYTFANKKTYTKNRVLNHTPYYNIHHIDNETELNAQFQSPSKQTEILVYLTDFSTQDFEIIKSIKFSNFNLEIILLFSKLSFDKLRLFSKLGIFSAHKYNSSQAIINLDIDSIIKKRKQFKDHSLLDQLLEKNKNTLDLDLFMYYKQTYLNLNHKDSLKHLKKASYSNKLEEIFFKTQQLDPDLSKSLNFPKLLIVEDDRNLSKRLFSWLKRKNFSCDTAYNASSAIQKSHECNFDLILLDIGLPDFTGDEIIKSLRALNPNCCIIALTGYKDVELLTHCLQVGAQDFITKPFIPSELLETINKNLKLSIIRSLPDSIFSSFFSKNYTTLQSNISNPY